MVGIKVEGLNPHFSESAFEVGSVVGDLLRGARPACMLSVTATRILSLELREFTTNSLKYGALANGGTFQVGLGNGARVSPLVY